MKPSRVLITGGAGFVGSNLALYLRSALAGVQIVALDNLSRRGSELNLPRLREAGIEFVHADIRNSEDLARLDPAGVVIECSAEPSVLAGQSSPRYVIETNLLGTINLLEYCRRHGSQLIFLSTSRVYPIRALRSLGLTENETRYELQPGQPVSGVSSEGISESFPMEGARSIYGATKYASELLIEEYAEAYGLRAIIDRCGVIAGPWQMGKVDQGFVALWVARHLLGGKLSYRGFGGSGKQVRDVLHIADLRELIELQLRNIEALAGLYNVGGGATNAVSLLELTALCQEVTGKRIEIGADPATHATDVPLYITDNARLFARCAWRPRRSVRDVVVDIAAWTETHRQHLASVLS